MTGVGGCGENGIVVSNFPSLCLILNEDFLVAAIAKRLREFHVKPPLTTGAIFTQPLHRIRGIVLKSNHHSSVVSPLLYFVVHIVRTKNMVLHASHFT